MMRIWGLPVVISDALPEGSGIIGDFMNFSALHPRRDVDMQISNSHSDFFINGKQAIRADLRTAFVLFRPTAFVRATGL